MKMRPEGQEEDKMKKNQNKETSKFFSFLADTLSISNLFTSNDNAQKAARASKTSVKKDMETEEYFNLLADSLSICSVVA